MATKNLSDYDISKVPDASNMIFGVVVAEWNPEITGALLDGCVSTLEKHGALPENIHVKTVPGSFELIYGAHQMTLSTDCLRPTTCSRRKTVPVDVWVTRAMNVQ